MYVPVERELRWASCLVRVAIVSGMVRVEMRWEWEEVEGVAKCSHGPSQLASEVGKSRYSCTRCHHSIGVPSHHLAIRFDRWILEFRSISIRRFPGTKC